MMFTTLRDELREGHGEWAGRDPADLRCCDCPGFVAALCRDDRVPETLGFCAYDGFDAVDGAGEPCDYLLDELDDLAAWRRAVDSLEAGDAAYDAAREAQWDR